MVTGEQDLHDTPVFKLVTESLDELAGKFAGILATDAFHMDADTRRELADCCPELSIDRLRIGLLVYHYCSFDRRIRVPLQRWTWGPPAPPPQPCMLPGARAGSGRVQEVGRASSGKLAGRGLGDGSIKSKVSPGGHTGC